MKLLMTLAAIASPILAGTADANSHNTRHSRAHYRDQAVRHTNQGVQPFYAPGYYQNPYNEPPQGSIATGGGRSAPSPYAQSTDPSTDALSRVPH